MEIVGEVNGARRDLETRSGRRPTPFPEVCL